jgi:hypothetical protein
MDNPPKIEHSNRTIVTIVISGRLLEIVMTAPVVIFGLPALSRLQEQQPLRASLALDDTARLARPCKLAHSCA